MSTCSSIFDPLNVQLNSGERLVEASAGTGKTWNITALFVRLLIDESCGEPPLLEQILVVTYTRAATAELRLRLRDRVSQTLAVLMGNAEEASIDQLLLPYRNNAELYERTCLRLKRALHQFDSAAIYTIHGFCQRVLQDAAFEAGLSFDVEMINDDDSILLSLAEDFWRCHIVYNNDYAALIAARGDTPQIWLAEIKPFIGKPHLIKRKPKISAVDLTQQLAMVWARFTQNIFDAGQQVFWHYFNGLNKQIYKAASYRSLFDWLQLFLGQTQPPELDNDRRKLLANLTPEVLSKKTNKNGQVPVHSLFNFIAEWLTVEAQWIQRKEQQVAWLKMSMIEWIDSVATQKRRQLRQRCFDDLLIDLFLALNQPQAGAGLARHMSNTWRVALVDEFQDTDSIQYEIFRTAFIQRGCPVYLVGDPKQAIYGFRGADIFAYLDAKKNADSHYTLTENHRSVPALVEGINRLFARKDAFLLEIPYISITSAGRQTALLDEGDSAAWVWQWTEGLSDKKLTKAQAEDLAAEQTANSIAALLTRADAGKVVFRSVTSSRALNGGDIAILVSNHRQADLLRKVLAEHGIGSESLTQQSVFLCHEAQELLILMQAWYKPIDVGLIRRALVTELIGLDAEMLWLLEQQENQWEQRLQVFAVYRQLWLEHGFMSAWRFCLSQENIAERLLPLPDGERRMTNLFHLTELIQQEAEHKVGLTPLLKWFEQNVAEPASNEEAMQRLESDATLVKISTIHAAKGLQYPIVYCPFLWDGKAFRKDEFVRFHEQGQSVLISACMADDQDRMIDFREDFAERLRVLYVALTRAEHRLVVNWMPALSMENAALSWLLHGEGCEGLPALQAKLKGQDNQTILSELLVVANSQPECVVLQSDSPQKTCFTPTSDHLDQFLARSMTRRVNTPWRISSFSGLTQHIPRPDLIEVPDYDNEFFKQVSDVTIDSVYDRFHLPKGTQTGLLLHTILERIDFTRSVAEQANTIASLLDIYGFESTWLNAVCDIINSVLQHPLDESGLRLSQIACDNRLIELQFNMPLQPLKVDELKLVLCDEQYGLSDLCRQAASHLQFPVVNGYLKGFIDLVILHQNQLYLLDYKSNYLGCATSDYGIPQLETAIAEHHYYLQYLIYCVALRRYLVSRKYNDHYEFAGVRYLFLRGLGKLPYGLWCDNPKEELLDRLDSLFGFAKAIWSR